MTIDKKSTALSRRNDAPRTLLQPEQYPVPQGCCPADPQKSWLQVLKDDFGEAGVDWSLTNISDGATVRFRSDAQGVHWRFLTSGLAKT